jgi:hypothetical protein
VPHGVATVVREHLANWKVTIQVEEQKLQEMDAETVRTDKTGWFKCTGWLEHLAKRNRVHLAHQVRLPDHNQANLQLAAKLVEQLMEQASKACRHLHEKYDDGLEVQNDLKLISVRLVDYRTQRVRPGTRVTWSSMSAIIFESSPTKKPE